MQIKIKLSDPVLFFLVLVTIVLSNVGCECRELSNQSSHSNFLKAIYKARGKNTHAWCAHDPEACSRSVQGRGYSQGNWVCCSKQYCIDVSSDQYHCGKCGYSCGYGLSCCGGKCIDLNNNNAHCGSCFNGCYDQEKCIFGICGYGYGYGYSKHT